MLKITRGDEIDLSLRVRGMNLSGSEIISRFRKSDGTLLEVPNAQHTLESETGVFTISLTDADTLLLRLGNNKFTSKVTQGDSILQFSGELEVSEGLFDVNEEPSLNQIFPVLEMEKNIQVGDKVRFDATKSFIAKGADQISEVSIKPGASGTAIDIFDKDPLNWYLDWKFDSFVLDVDSTNNKISFVEGGAELTATVADGSYTLSTIAAAIKTAMDAAGGTYTITINKDEKMVIVGLVNFKLLPVTGAQRDNSILKYLGFKIDSPTNTTTQTGEVMDSWCRKVVLTVGEGVADYTETKYINVLSESGDALFSNDGDLMTHESDILKFVPQGRSSFKNIHRRCQELIIAWLDEQGYVNVFGNKFTKWDIKDVEEVRQWSTAMALKLIFRSVSNAVDDVFAERAKEYSIQEIVHRNRSVLRIDTDKDGVADQTETLSTWSGVVIRR